jgi:multidrug efflux pump subunit AcrB
MIAKLISHRATAWLAVASIFIFGFMTYRSLPREAAPDVKVPVVMITTTYIGVSPEDVETLITLPLENELAGIKDLKKMTSTSAEGMSLVSLEFEPEVVISDALQRVRDRVSRAKTDLPDEADEPTIREVSFSDVPVLIVTVAGPIDEEELKRYGERLKDAFDRIPGVLETNLSGGRTKALRVQLDPRRLEVYGLSSRDVVNAIADENVNIPGGEVRSGDASYLLRVPGKLETTAAIESVAVKRVGGRPVFVRDVGAVVDGFEDRTSYSRMNGQTAVSIAVKKRAGANILQVAEAVKAELAVQEAKWPQGVKAEILGDQSRFIADTVSELENSIITALLMVVAVILFFMGVRNSLFVAVSIPLSMLLGLVVIWALGITLNMVVLFSLILVLGMLVDNGIVLVENIYRHVEEGADLVTASIRGTKEVAMPVTASTLTTVAAFAPLMFWSGIMGGFMGFLPKTVVIVLLSSLAVAIAILPVLTSRFMKRPKATVRKVDERSRLMTLYERTLRWAIGHRYLSAGLGLASLVGSVWAYGMLNHGTEFFPDVEPDRATVTVNAPDGTDLEATDRLVRRVETVLAAQANVEVYVAETGVSGGGEPTEGAMAAPNRARITVEFLPHSTKAKPGDRLRVEDTRLTIDRIRNELAEIPGAEFIVDKERQGPPVGPPIAVEISGDDFDELGAIAAQAKRKMAALPAITDVSDDYRVGRPEMRLRIDRGAAKKIGASSQKVAGTVRTAVAGSTASTVREGEDEIDIVVELAPEHRDDLQSVLALRVPGSDDGQPRTYPVPMSAVASYELAGGSGSIRHIDQKRVVTIEAAVVEGQNENAARERVQAFLATLELPEGYSARLGGADDEQRKAQAFLATAFIVAIFLIAFVLVTQFNSFTVPLIILGSVVLSMVGVLWGLVITGTPFGILMTGIGVISLAGVVVNNAIVLLDYVRSLQKQGLEMTEALVRAGLVRFRPVMLTALTTMLGLLPMALGISVDFSEMRLLIGGSSAAWWGPMAVAVIFGLAFATILTLVMVPTLYALLEDLRGKVRGLAERLRKAAPPSRVGAAEGTV